LSGTAQSKAQPGAIQGFAKEPLMNITLAIGPLVSLIAGILILAMPRLLNYIVALYLIIMGVLGLLGMGNLKL
jgi:hypothetical protein